MRQNGVIAGLMLLIFSSCATHQGYLSTNAVIIDKNFRMIGLGVGESKTQKVFGFGGLKSNAMVFEAKEDLYKKVALEPGQALTNITVDFKREYYIFFSNVKVTVTGEIIDFNTVTAANEKNEYNIIERNGFKVGEMAYIKLDSGYQKRTIQKLDLHVIQFENDSLEPSSKPPLVFSYDQPYNLKGKFTFKGMEYTVGDKIEFEGAVSSPIKSKSKTIIISGTVVGIRSENALLLKDDGTFTKVSIND